MYGSTLEIETYKSDEDLLAGLTRGEPDACVCMVQRFAPLIYARALRLVGDPDDAEGILQQTLASACLHITSFQGRSGLGSWLYRIASNEAFMLLRRRRFYVDLDSISEAARPADLPHNFAPHTYDPSAAVLDHELRTQLEDALAALPVSQRSVFILRELDGWSTEETAEMLGIGVSAAKVRLHRARQRLRELLADYLLNDPE